MDLPGGSYGYDIKVFGSYRQSMEWSPQSIGKGQVMDRVHYWIQWLHLHPFPLKERSSTTTKSNFRYHTLPSVVYELEYKHLARRVLLTIATNSQECRMGSRLTPGDTANSCQLGGEFVESLPLREIWLVNVLVYPQYPVARCRHLQSQYCTHFSHSWKKGRKQETSSHHQTFDTLENFAQVPWQSGILRSHSAFIDLGE